MSRPNLLKALTAAPQPTAAVARAAYIRSNYQAKKMLRSMEADGLVDRVAGEDGGAEWYLTERGEREKGRATSGSAI